MATAKDSPSDAVVATPMTFSLPAIDTTLDAPNFQCVPKVFTRKDTLTLRAEVPHGGYLAVTNPDGLWFMLIAPTSHDTPYRPLVDPGAFKDMLILRLRADLRSRESIYGRDSLLAVFTKPGEYAFTIGENLETEYDAEDPNWHCSVRLTTSP